MGQNNAKLPQLDVLFQAGIDPKTGLPLKLAGAMKCTLKEDIKIFLRIIDEQDAVNRYIWYNLPTNITSQELERMLYYKGQLAFFYEKTTERFYFMPYALDGTIDFYGRANTIHPVPFTSGTDEEKEKKQTKALAEILSKIKLDCVYGIVLPEDVDEKMITKSTVLLHDYTKQLSQNIISRQVINDPIIDVMSEMIPMMRTNMIASCGVKGVRVNDADQAHDVEDASRTLINNALTGKPWVSLIGNIDFQELTGENAGKLQEYLLAMQSIDNLRLSGYGIDNGGLFEKKAHELQSEADLNGGPVGLVMQDGLSIRQNFCNIVNSIWNLGIWVEPAENISGTDRNGDGVIYDDNVDGSNTGVENNEGDDNNE